MNPDEREIGLLLREKYGGALTKQAEEDILRLRQGEHLDYVIGFVPFLGTRIDLSFRPLIPRAETEEWTERLISRMREEGRKTWTCLDLFAGSGCAGVAILAHVPGASVDFADIDISCLEQIRLNVQKNGIEAQRVDIVRSDIFSNLAGQKYDLICANPPYIPESRRDLVQPSVLRAEPAHALFGGPDGLAYIRPFLRDLELFMNPGGMAVMEYDTSHRDEIEALLEGRPARFERDQYGEWRTVWMRF